MLSKYTTDQINKEADEFGFQVPYNGTNKFYNEDRLKGYIAGAEKWAIWKEKAAAASIERDMLLLDKEGLRRALEEIRDTLPNGRIGLIATKALESFK